MESSAEASAQVNPGKAWEIREALTSDLDFVADSWRRSHGDAYSARAPSLDEYIAAQRRAVATALATSRVVIAHVAGEPDQLLGWCAFREHGPVVHYVYVKAYARKRGIGQELLSRALSGAAGRIWYTHNYLGCPTQDVTKHILAKLSATGVRAYYCPVLVFGGSAS